MRRNFAARHEVYQQCPDRVAFPGEIIGDQRFDRPQQGFATETCVRLALGRVLVAEIFIENKLDGLGIAVNSEAALAPVLLVPVGFAQRGHFGLDLGDIANTEQSEIACEFIHVLYRITR